MLSGLVGERKMGIRHQPGIRKASTFDSQPVKVNRTEKSRHTCYSQRFAADIF
jgi:hypothetical protein